MSKYLSLKEFYEAAYKVAIECDPRGKDVVQKFLADAKSAYEKITDENKKKYFDEESLSNPYADSRILNGDLNTEIKKIFAGIDMCSVELILADRLNERGEDISLVLTHHPNGMATANFYEVMSMQVDMYENIGVPVVQAEAVNKKRIAEVARSVSAANHMRDLDCARLLKLPYACMHTLADNHVQTFLTKLMQETKPYKVSDVLDILNGVEEYQIASKNNNPPKMIHGAEGSRCGRVVIDMTGGTSGDFKTIEHVARAGVGTIVVMHLPEKHREECEKHNVNVVCAGHIASDSLGMNLLFKSIRETTKKTFEVLAASGLILVDR